MINQTLKSTAAVQGTLEQIEKGGYKHFMLKEIHEQPRFAPNHPIRVFVPPIQPIRLSVPPIQPVRPCIPSIQPIRLFVPAILPIRPPYAFPIRLPYPFPNRLEHFMLKEIHEQPRFTPNHPIRLAYSSPIFFLSSLLLSSLELSDTQSL